MSAPEVRTPGGNLANADTKQASPDFAIAEAARKAKKDFASAQAEAAYAGGILTVIEGDHGGPEYVLVRNALCKRFQSLPEVRSWLRERGREQ